MARRTTSSVLRLFFPLLLGFSGGCMLWGITRYEGLPHLHRSQRHSTARLESSEPVREHTGAYLVLRLVIFSARAPLNFQFHRPREDGLMG
jgi:hypothetical protein